MAKDSMNSEAGTLSMDIFADSEQKNENFVNVLKQVCSRNRALEKQDLWKQKRIQDQGSATTVSLKSNSGEVMKTITRIPKDANVTKNNFNQYAEERVRNAERKEDTALNRFFDGKDHAWRPDSFFTGTCGDENTIPWPIRPSDIFTNPNLCTRIMEHRTKIRKKRKEEKKRKKEQKKQLKKEKKNKNKNKNKKLEIIGREDKKKGKNREKETRQKKQDQYTTSPEESEDEEQEAKLKQRDPSTISIEESEDEEQETKLEKRDQSTVSPEESEDEEQEDAEDSSASTSKDSVSVCSISSGSGRDSEGSEEATFSNDSSDAS